MKSSGKSSMLIHALFAFVFKYNMSRAIYMNYILIYLQTFTSSEAKIYKFNRQHYWFIPYLKDWRLIYISHTYTLAWHS